MLASIESRRRLQIRSPRLTESLFQQPGGSRDEELEFVLDRLSGLSGPDPEALFARAIRQSIDEVLDGPRTGRWDFGQLEKTEKTYVGTKMEIIVRTALGLERGRLLDLDIEGVPVDIKWAMNSDWQIPREAVDRLCLCIGGIRKMSHFVVGLIRCSEDVLNAGKNQDKKRTISAAGKGSMRFLVTPASLPPNFLATLDAHLRDEILAGRDRQDRVTRLFQLVPRMPIPRTAIATVARTTGDPMRRVRADASREDQLGGMQVLSAKYGNQVVEALGYPRLGRDEFMSVPRDEIRDLSCEARASLPERTLRRLGLA
jgi:hypothetical protein